MGSPEDEEGRDDNEFRHKVKITRPFYLAETEVTQAQWEKVMGNNPSEFEKGGNYPVEQVSWNDVRGDISGRPDPNSFCGRTGLELPTEAQWEYAWSCEYDHGILIRVECRQVIPFWELL